MDEDDLEVAELVDYLRHRVGVWNDRATTCRTKYAGDVCRDMAQQCLDLIEQIEIDQRESAEE